MKWKGYDDGDNTWEPIENLTGSKEALMKFYQLRLKERRKNRGTEVPPNPSDFEELADVEDLNLEDPGSDDDFKPEEPKSESDSEPEPEPSSESDRKSESEEEEGSDFEEKEKTKKGKGKKATPAKASAFTKLMSNRGNQGLSSLL